MGILTKLEIDGSLVIEGTIPGLVCQGSFGTFKCCGHQILIIYYLTVMCLSESRPLAFYSKFSQVRLLRYRWLEYPFPAKTTYNCVRSNPCMYFLFSFCVCVCVSRCCPLLLLLHLPSSPQTGRMRRQGEAFVLTHACTSFSAFVSPVNFQKMVL